MNKSLLADRFGVSCYMSCTTQPACQSLNYNLADKSYEFNNNTKYFVEKPTYFYPESPKTFVQNPSVALALQLA